MATVKSIVDVVVCGGGGTPNTGKLGCLSLFGEPTHMIALTKGYKIAGTATFNLALLTPLVKQGIAIPLIDASSFEDVSGEDSYSTNTKGVKRLNLKGLPEYKLMFEEGHEFYRQIDELRSFKSKDFIIGDDEGNWMVVKNSDGTYGGFTAGHVTPELTKRKVSGGDAEMKSVLVQFLNRLQWDRNYGILHQNELDFAPNEIPAINGSHLEFSAVPADTDTNVLVTAHLNSDHSSSVSGLLVGNFYAKVNSATVVISAVTETSGVYSLTIPALSTNDILEIGLWDTTLNVEVTEVAGDLFRATPALTVTV
tara:strand:- start:1560 stop:2489 length:930 start_codon:yes stop_codon:yes gene_type:complete